MSFSYRVPGRTNRRSSGVPAFNGNFASLFPGALQVMQSDKGMTYGGVPLAATGNTSTTTLALTGTLATAPVPIRVKATSSAAVGAGAAFDISFDVGATFAMTVVTPSVGVPVALTGAGSGLSITWAAGNAVQNDTWDATVSAIADQSGNGKNFAQVVAAKQPIVGLFNSKASFLTVASRNQVLESTIAIPAPSVTTRTHYCVFRCTSNEASQQDFFGGSSVGGLAGIIFASTGNFTTSLRQYSGSAGAIVGGVAVGTMYRAIANGTNSVSDSLRVGSNVATGVNSGNAALTDFFIGSGGTLFPATMECLLSVWMPGTITSFPAADVAVAAYYGATVAL